MTVASFSFFWNESSLLLVGLAQDQQIKPNTVLRCQQVTETQEPDTSSSRSVCLLSSQNGVQPPKYVLNIPGIPITVPRKWMNISIITD
jgi:hypothetical protein